MTTTATMSSSSLSSPNPSPTSNTLSAHLDSQIARLNAQIANLREEKQSLSSALLASSTVQNIVQSRKSTQNDIRDLKEHDTYRRLEEAVAKQQKRMDITVHRLMNNVTGFPFTDPAPDRIRNGEGSMLGLRFEMPRIPTNQGNGTNTDSETERIFLVVLRRTQHGGKTYLHFQPEMNQIPKHIDVEGFAAQYLPVPDTDDDNSRRSPSVPGSESLQDDSGIDVTQDLTHLMNGTNGHAASTTNRLSTQNQNPSIDMTNTNQSLPLFVSTTRNALLSWHYRNSYIHYLISSLTLSSTSTPPIYKHAILTLQPNPPATKLTIDWTNGTTALLAINDNGQVGIARVFGPKIHHGDEEINRDDGTFRCHGVERRLEGVRLSELAARLEEVGELMSSDG